MLNSIDFIRLIPTRQPRVLKSILLAGSMLSVMAPTMAYADCTPRGTLTPGTIITCNGTETSRVGQGPGADTISVIVNDGATISVLNTNAISLGSSASIFLGTGGPIPGGSASNPAVTVRTTTDAAASGGQYNDGSNTIDAGSNSLIVINRNAAVIAVGTQPTSEAINFYGSGNTVINYGLIQGGPSSAIFFQNVNTTALSARNIVDNFGTIQLLPLGAVNPVTSGQAVSSIGSVGIDFINRTGAKVIGNLEFQGGDDRVTFNPGSSITGDLNGGGGDNVITLNAAGSSSDLFAGQLNNFQNLIKTGSGTWTLMGPIGNNTAAGASSLAIGVLAGKLVVTGNNTAFNGTIAINPGATVATPGLDRTATLEARVQSLPPLITDHGVLLLNQFSADATQPVDGVYNGVIQGSGVVTKTGVGTVVLNSNNTYTGLTTVTAGALAIGDTTRRTAVLSGTSGTSVASGAVLGGYGQVNGSVTNAGTISAGNAVRLFAGSPVGSFTIGGALINSGAVNVAGSSIGNTLVVNGNYTGVNGTITVATLLNAGGPLSNQFTDRVLIGGNASGSTLVRVVASGAGAFTSTGVPTASDGISIIQVTGASAANTFLLADTVITGGTPFRYSLNAYGPGSPNGLAAASQTLVGNAGNQWDYRLQTAFVTPVGPVNPTQPINPAIVRPGVVAQIPAYIATPTALFNVGGQDLDGLHRRLGEIRQSQARGDDTDGEVFARAIGGNLDYTSDRSFKDYGIDTSEEYVALQVGANWVAHDDNDGTLRVGLAATFDDLKLEPHAVDGISYGQFDIKTLAGIATWQSATGWYADAILTAGRFKGHITAPTLRQDTSLKGTSTSASLEVGYPIALGQTMTLEPQAQVTYQRLKFDRRTDVDGIDINAGTLGQGVARIGTRLTRAYTYEDGSVITPYLKANVLQGLGGGESIYLSNVGFGTGEFGRVAQLGGGITGSPSANVSMYADVAWQTKLGGDGGARGFTYSAGLRYTF